jgi:hypothetical protein
MYQPNIFHSQPLVKHLIDVSVVNIQESFSMLIDRKESYFKNKTEGFRL